MNSAEYEKNLENINIYLSTLQLKHKLLDSVLIKDLIEALSIDEAILFFDMLDYKKQKKTLTGFKPRHIPFSIDSIMEKSDKFISLDDKTVTELFNDFTIEEILTFLTLMKKTEKYKAKNDINSLKLEKGFPKRDDVKEFKFEYEEITPYKTLGLEEGVYTKEELELAMEKRIKEYQKLSASKDKEKSIQNKIDDILDAYNQLLKKTNQK